MRVHLFLFFLFFLNFNVFSHVQQDCKDTWSRQCLWRSTTTGMCLQWGSYEKKTVCTDVSHSHVVRKCIPDSNGFWGRWNKDPYKGQLCFVNATDTSWANCKIAYGFQDSFLTREPSECNASDSFAYAICVIGADPAQCSHFKSCYNNNCAKNYITPKCIPESHGFWGYWDHGSKSGYACLTNNHNLSWANCKSAYDFQDSFLIRDSSQCNTLHSDFSSFSCVTNSSTLECTNFETCFYNYCGSAKTNCYIFLEVDTGHGFMYLDTGLCDGVINPNPINIPQIEIDNSLNCLNSNFVNNCVDSSYFNFSKICLKNYWRCGIEFNPDI